MIDSTSPVAVNVPKDNDHSASDADIAASFVTLRNGANDPSNLLSPNNSEEPLPPELYPTQVLVKVRVSRVRACACTHTHTQTHTHTNIVYSHECVNAQTVCAYI